MAKHCGICKKWEYDCICSYTAELESLTLQLKEKEEIISSMKVDLQYVSRVGIRLMRRVLNKKQTDSEYLEEQLKVFWKVYESVSTPESIKDQQGGG